MLFSKCSFVELIVIFGLVGCNEVIESKFPTYEDLKRAGYLEKGWIPECLPSTSTNFVEVHDLDTNVVWCKFQFKPGDISSIKQIINPLTKTTNVSLFQHFSAPRWWPKGIPEQYELYSLSTKPPCRQYYKYGYFAINWTNGSAYFWSP